MPVLPRTAHDKVKNIFDLSWHPQDCRCPDCCWESQNHEVVGGVGWRTSNGVCHVDRSSVDGDDEGRRSKTPNGCGRVERNGCHHVNGNLDAPCTEHWSRGRLGSEEEEVLNHLERQLGEYDVDEEVYGWKTSSLNGGGGGGVESPVIGWRCNGEEPFENCDAGHGCRNSRPDYINGYDPNGMNRNGFNGHCGTDNGYDGYPQYIGNGGDSGHSFPLENGNGNQTTNYNHYNNNNYNNYIDYYFDKALKDPNYENLRNQNNAGWGVGNGHYLQGCQRYHGTGVVVQEGNGQSEDLDDGALVRSEDPGSPQNPQQMTRKKKRPLTLRLKDTIKRRYFGRLDPVRSRSSLEWVILVKNLWLPTETSTI